LAEEHKIWRSLLFIVSYLVLVIKTAEAVKSGSGKSGSGKTANERENKSGIFM